MTWSVRRALICCFFDHPRKEKSQQFDLEKLPRKIPVAVNLPKKGTYINWKDYLSSLTSDLQESSLFILYKLRDLPVLYSNNFAISEV